MSFWGHGLGQYRMFVKRASVSVTNAFSLVRRLLVEVLPPLVQLSGPTVEGCMLYGFASLSAYATRLSASSLICILCVCDQKIDSRQ